MKTYWPRKNLPTRLSIVRLYFRETGVAREPIVILSTVQHCTGNNCPESQSSHPGTTNPKFTTKVSIDLSTPPWHFSSGRFSSMLLLLLLMRVEVSRHHKGCVFSCILEELSRMSVHSMGGHCVKKFEKLVHKVAV